MTVITTIVIVLAVFYVPVILYLKTGLFKFFYHDMLGWHQPDNSPEWFDGCSTHSVCKHCKREIMQDSQGNWF